MIIERPGCWPPTTGAPRPERRGPRTLQYLDVPQTLFQANFPSWLAFSIGACMDFCGTEKSEAVPLGAVEVAPGDDIQIRSMAVLSGIGDLGVPSQRSVMFALAQYGPNKGTMSRWAQASTVSEPEREAAARPIL